MTLRIDTVAIADATAVDSRGSVSLIGFNPQVILVEQLPAQISPSFVVSAEDEYGTPPVLNPGMTVTVRIQVEGPDGDILFLAQGKQATQSSRPRFNINHRVQVIAQTPFTAAKAGRYVFTAEIKIDDVDHEPLVARRTTVVSDMQSLKELGAEG